MAKKSLNAAPKGVSLWETVGERGLISLHVMPHKAFRRVQPPSGIVVCETGRPTPEAVPGMVIKHKISMYTFLSMKKQTINGWSAKKQNITKTLTCVQ